MKTVNIVTTIHLLFFLFATFFLVQVGLYEERKVLNIVESTKYKGINPFTFRFLSDPGIPGVRSMGRECL